LFHASTVKIAISLGAGRPHGGALTGVEKPKLDTSGIYVPGHLTAECIDFTHQMPLCQPAYCRVAGHLRNRIKVKGEEKDTATHTGSSQSCLTARVAGTYNNHIIIVRHKSKPQTSIRTTNVSRGTLIYLPIQKRLNI
jgi:hypothetical protein